MIKRINSLGRRRISKDCVTIHVADGHPRLFSADIRLSQDEWPGEAEVVMEATCAGSNLVRRFPCGTVGNIQSPQSEELQDLSGRNVTFTLKIIDRGQALGRILGLAENLRPTKAGAQTEAGRRGILPVEPANLGQQLWKLEYREHDVFLLVNNQIKDLASQVQSDPTVFALIFPMVVRDVLLRAIEEASSDDDDSDPERWPNLWLKFGRSLHPSHEEAPSSNDNEEAAEWVEEVVTAFCEQQRLREKYDRAAASAEQGGD